jgi:hypothetical protein
MVTRNGMRRFIIELSPEDNNFLEAVKSILEFNSLRAAMRYCLKVGHSRAKSTERKQQKLSSQSGGHVLDNSPIPLFTRDNSE